MDGEGADPDASVLMLGVGDDERNDGEAERKEDAVFLRSRLLLTRSSYSAFFLRRNDDNSATTSTSGDSTLGVFDVGG